MRDGEQMTGRMFVTAIAMIAIYVGALLPWALMPTPGAPASDIYATCFQISAAAAADADGTDKPAPTPPFHCPACVVAAFAAFTPPAPNVTPVVFSTPVEVRPVLDRPMPWRATAPPRPPSTAPPILKA